MKSEALRLFDLPLLPLAGLLIFFVLFMGITYWAFKDSNRKKFEKAARLPLEDSTDE